MWFRRNRGIRITWAAGLVTLLALQGCGSLIPSLPSRVAPRPTPTPAPSLVPAAKIVVGIHVGSEHVGVLPGLHRSDMPLFPQLPNGIGWDQVVRRMIFSGIYRLDDRSRSVPDLAAAPCKPSGGGLVITCRIQDARFHDGTPLTADDVAYTFELLGSQFCAAAHCVLHLAGVDVVDPRTVAFRLTEPDATFLEVALADVVIESKARITASYLRLQNGLRGRNPVDLIAEADTLDARREDLDPDCTPLIEDGEAAVRAFGIEPWDRDEFNIKEANGFDACGYVENLSRALREAAMSLGFQGVDAVAAAYRILDYHNDEPVGSGPWKVLSVDPGSRMMRLAAFDDFFRGRPATAAVDVELIRGKADAINAVHDHEVDWLVQPFMSQTPQFLRDGLAGDEAGLTINDYQNPSWFALHYNVRPGALFHDLRLRQALELCIDKEETVATIWRGQAVPIQGPVLPSSWANVPALKPVKRDVDEANRLIREAGWRLDANGIYTQGEVSLTALVPIKPSRKDRLAFLRLIEDQVLDCGMRISPFKTERIDCVLSWPLVVPSANLKAEDDCNETPHWDIDFNGYIGSDGFIDPGLNDSLFRSSQITTKDLPEGNNVMGYMNETVDGLIEKARRTYVAADRARLYREIQVELVKDPPMFFAYALRGVEFRSDQLSSTGGPLSIDSPTWWWELERLVKYARAP
jgi:ABC-type transport system substrate-binding protein